MKSLLVIILMCSLLLFTVMTLVTLLLYSPAIMSLKMVRRRRIDPYMKLKAQDRGLAESLGRLLRRIERPIASSSHFRMMYEDAMSLGLDVDYESLARAKIIYPLLLAGCGMTSLVALSFVEVMNIVLFFIFAILAVAQFCSADSFIVRKREERMNDVMLELPRLIKTIRYSPIEKSLFMIVSDYMKVAKTCIYEDLRLLYIDLELSGSVEAPLRAFSHRMQMAEVRELVSVLICAQSGDRKAAYASLVYIENKTIEMSKRIIRRKLRKRPEMIEAMNEILLYSLGLIFVVPMVVSLIGSLGFIMEK